MTYVAGLPSWITYASWAISGCPVSYEVSYKSMFAITPFRCSTYSLNLQPLKLARLSRSRRTWLVRLFVHLLHRLWLGSYACCTYLCSCNCCTYFRSCTCCTRPHLLRDYIVYLIHTYPKITQFGLGLQHRKHRASRQCNLRTCISRLSTPVVM